MSSNQETTSRVEVGAGDIQITEKGGVEIINLSLAEILKAAIERDRGEAIAARGAANTNNCPQYVCGTNIPCKGNAAG